MARIRNLKPEFFTDSDLCEHPPLERILFEGLWCFADCEGRLEDRPRELKVKLLPYDDCDVDKMLDNLARPKPGRNFGFVRRYSVAGKCYLQIEKFTEHQKFHHAELPRGFPAPPTVAQASPVAAPDLSQVSPPTKRAETEANPVAAQGEPRADQVPAPVQPEANRPEDGRRKTEDGKRKEALSTSQSTAPLAVVGEAPTPVAVVFEHWRQKLRPKAKADKKRVRCVKARLREGFSAEDLCKAVDGCAADPFSQGKNDRGQRYDDLELICRDAAHVEKFLSLATDTGPPGTAAPMRRLKANEDPYAMEA